MKLQHSRQQSIADRLYYKLRCRYFGPYQLASHIGEVIYESSLLEGGKRPIFHIPLLKDYVETESSDTDDTIEQQPYASISDRELLVKSDLIQQGT